VTDTTYNIPDSPFVLDLDRRYL